MAVSDSLKIQVLSHWLPIVIIPVLIISALGLSCWVFNRRRRRRRVVNTQKINPPSNDIALIKTVTPSRNIDQTLLPKRAYLLSPTHSSTSNKITSSSQLTDTDIAHLDKLVRTASDRSMWNRDNLTKDKLRKVPSGQIQLSKSTK